MFFIRPDISFAGDEEVRRALKCECGGDLHHDKNSLNQVSGLILISRSMTIKSGSHDSKTRDNDIADIADFARGGTCLNSLIFLSLMFLCISLLVLNARFHLLSCSPFFVFRFHFPKESGGFKVIFELGRRPSTMAQAMYQCKTSNCSKTYGATDPHILRSMPRRYFGSWYYIYSYWDLLSLITKNANIYHYAIQTCSVLCLIFLTCHVFLWHVTYYAITTCHVFLGLCGRRS
jgi:hypothetical protein